MALYPNNRNAIHKLAELSMPSGGQPMLRITTSVCSSGLLSKPRIHAAVAADFVQGIREARASNVGGHGPVCERSDMFVGRQVLRALPKDNA